MRRRVLLTLAAGGLLAGCGPRSGTPAASSSSTPARAAVAADYQWFTQDTDLRKGFFFGWVHDRTSQQVLDLMGADELERVDWRQLVGAGDGQRGADRYYFGVARVGDWALVIEDNGGLGRADDLLRRLSAGTTLVCHYRAPTDAGRFLLMADGITQLDFDPAVELRRAGTRAAELELMMEAVGFGASADPTYRTQAAFALTERLTGVAMTPELLREKTYLFSTAARG